MGIDELKGQGDEIDELEGQAEGQDVDVDNLRVC